MDWAKAKIYIIIMLFVLNCILGIFNVIKFGRYSLSDGNINNVCSILKGRGVTIKCSIPKTYAPISNMEMKNREFDYISFCRIFFASDDIIKQSIEMGERQVYSENNDKILRYSDNTLIFNGTFKDGEENTIVEKIKKEIEKEYFFMDKVRDDTMNGVRNIAYSRRYNGFYVYNSGLSFRFDYAGKYEVRFSFMEPTDFVGGRNEIYPSSEAIYKFSSEVGKIYDLENYNIVDVSLGYYYDSDNIFSEGKNIAIPCYRIYVEGISEPFYINAIENDFMYENI